MLQHSRFQSHPHAIWEMSLHARAAAKNHRMKVARGAPTLHATGLPVGHIFQCTGEGKKPRRHSGNMGHAGPISQAGAAGNQTALPGSRPVLAFPEKWKEHGAARKAPKPRRSARHSLRVM